MPEKRAPLEILAATIPPVSVEETIFSHRFCQDYLKEFAAPARVKAVPQEALQTVSDLRSQTDAEIVLIVQDPETLLPPVAFDALPMILAASEWKALVPVFNASREPSQRAVPPFLYHNVRNLIEISELFHQTIGNLVKPVRPSAEWPCVIADGRAFDAVDGDVRLDELFRQWAEAGLVGQAEGVFVHRFSDYYAAPRDDLIELIPADARRILDVGCARGYLGKALKARRSCRLTGVEMNRLMADEAARTYDRVHNMPVEDVDFNETFDAAICGDLIEHLREPLAVLSKLRNVLEPGGCLIGSVPNVGHWSIVQDLAAGRFEMIPVGLLCMSHIRFFTEAELTRILDKAGFTCAHLETDRPQPTPSGEHFIRLLVEAGCGNEDSLRTAELRFRARR